MIKISVEQTIMLQKLLVKETGGEAGVRSYPLLESAMEAPFAAFEGFDAYPSIEEKGARIAYNLIKNHAFVDGNKRIGINVMFVFLSLNGIELTCTDEDVVNLGLGIAEGNISYENLVSWIMNHKVNI